MWNLLFIEQFIQKRSSSGAKPEPMSTLKTSFVKSFVVVPMILTSVSVNSLTASVTQYLSTQQNDQSSVTVSAEEQAIQQERELKAAKIDTYFRTKHLPILVGHGMTFVVEAEKQDIPYNLLPAIAMAESTGCVHIIPGTNNCYGWDNGKTKFASIDAGIAIISQHLGGNYPTTARYYENKSVAGILKMYNPPQVAPEYIGTVTYVMRAIDATVINQ